MKYSIIVKKEEFYKEIPLDKNIFFDKMFNLVSESEAIYIFKIKDGIIENNIENDKLEMYKDYVIENVEYQCFYDEGKCFSKKYDMGISFGNSEKNAIQFLNKNVKCYIEKRKFFVEENLNCKIYKNGKLLKTNQVMLEEGDCFLIDDMKVIVYDKNIIIKGKNNSYISHLQSFEMPNFYFEGFPNYKRSPRIIKQVPTEEIDILTPPVPKGKSKGQLVRLILPPIVTLAGTILMSFMMRQGLYVIIGAITTVMTVVFSITSYINEKKETIAYNRKREKIYREYLLKTRKKINYSYKQQIEALEYNNPSIKQIEKMINTYDNRIYERNANDSDFIQVAIGMTDMETSFKLKNPAEELAMHKDELLEEAEELYYNFNKVIDMPVIVDLKNTHLGLVGEKSNIHERIKMMIIQLTFQQSYHDLEMILFCNEKYEDEFKGLDWYPHFKIHSINVTGIINSERVRDQVLGNITQILKERKLMVEEEKKETRFLPHFLFIIDEPKLVMNHSIIEYLQKENFDLGVSIIYTTQLKANLPENIKTVLLVEDSENGKLLLNEGIIENTKIKFKQLENIKLEVMARKLSCLNHIQGMSSQIPESVSFFELYKVQHPEELNVKERWKKNSTYKTLAVPLGLRGEDDIVELNLHEKAHGPHGLVAGTTGSGKSEIVQSYILSLAVNFHPYDIGFLLIDYKGGGMASLFKKLPHLLGTITNLDGAESMRAMASIKSELERRQTIFNKYNVNHINQYSKVFKNGDASEPMPHLFLISDEFAELKKEQPEFMKELVSTARIGRSLGVHLILATQKPSGVVDDQIWTNSRFKLALKVANTSDSNEVLKTPDAASITQAGRAYLQVGNNEIYELFQSAFSGATYYKEKEETIEDNRTYLINDLGQGELLNQDLSDSTDESNKLKATELDVTIDCIKKAYDDLNIEDVAKTWLPSLNQKIVSPYINKEKIVDVEKIVNVDLTAKVGLIDIPEQQKQIEYLVDFNKIGNMAVFASAGFGKSTVITTIALTVAIKNSVKRVRYYIIDFGNSSLIQLKNLPQTADYFTFDDIEKIVKLIKLLEDELKRRKQLFAEKSALNFEMYNEIVNEKLDAIFIFIDNYDVIKEIDLEVEEFLVKLTRDGSGLGIFTIVTATRESAVRYSVLNNFKTKIAMYLFDETEYVSLVGRTNYKLSEIKGRSLIKLENVNQMQFYTAVNFDNQIDYMNNVKEIIDILNNMYTGEKAKGIPMLSDILTIEELKTFVTNEIPNNKVPIGVDSENVQLQYIDYNNGVQLIIGAGKTGKTNVLKVLIRNTSLEDKIYLVDSQNNELNRFDSKENVVYIAEIEKLKTAIEELRGLIDERKDMLQEAKEKDKTVLPKQFYLTLPNIILMIDDCDNFIGMIEDIGEDAEEIIMNLGSVNINIIATTATNRLKGYEELSSYFKESTYGMILEIPDEQTIYNVPYEKMNKVPIDIAFLYENGDLTKIKIPLESQGD